MCQLLSPISKNNEIFKMCTHCVFTLWGRLAIYLLPVGGYLPHYCWFYLFILSQLPIWFINKSNKTLFQVIWKIFWLSNRFPNFDYQIVFQRDLWPTFSHKRPFLLVVFGGSFWFIDLLLVETHLGIWIRHWIFLHVAERAVVDYSVDNVIRICVAQKCGHSLHGDFEILMEIKRLTNIQNFIKQFRQQPRQHFFFFFFFSGGVAMVLQHRYFIQETLSTGTICSHGYGFDINALITTFRK